MKIILLQNVAKVGQKGEIKNVADGFARNSLIPQGKAVEATQGALQRIAQAGASTKAAQDTRTNEFKTCAVSLVQEPLIITQTANEDGTLFAAVSAQIVAQKISERCNLVIDAKDDIEIPAPIKSTGEHTIHLAGIPVVITVVAE